MNQITTCPHCSKRLRVSEQITDKTLICPHCLAEVDNPQPGFQIRAADLDTDVKRGLSMGSIILAVLIGICTLGVVLGFVAVRNPNSDLAGVALLCLSFGALDVLVSIAIIRLLVNWGLSGVRAPSVGRSLGIAFLSLGTIVAVCIFFFFTCMAMAVKF